MKKFIFIGIGIIFVVASPFLLKLTSVFENQNRAHEEPTKLFWKDLRLLNLETGEVPTSLEEVRGRWVQIPGFVVPLEDEAMTVREFVLVPTPMACIHVPAPPPNQIVHVELVESVEIFDLYRPIFAIGVFVIDPIEMIYGPASFSLKSARIEPYRRL